MRKIKTRITALLLAAITAVVLTGCMDMRMDIILHPDGSGTVTARVLIDREAYLEGENALSDSLGIEATGKDKKELEETLLGEGFKLVTENGKQYYSYSETQKIGKEELENYLSQGMDSSYVTPDTFYVRFLATDTQTGGGLSLSDMQGLTAAQGGNIPVEAVTFELSVTFDKPVVSTNGTVDADKPNRVLFKVSLDHANKLFATSKTGVTIKSVEDMLGLNDSLKAPKIKKIKSEKPAKNAKKASVRVKLKKVKGADKYQIQYSVRKNFKKAKTVTAKKTLLRVKGLKKGKKYYFRARAVKKNTGGSAIYSKWTKASVKTKR